MTEPIQIDGKQYEQHPFNGLMEGWIALKPLLKQPEEEKHTYCIDIHRLRNNYVLEESYEWTNSQAQLAADAVRTVLQYIQGAEDIEKADIMSYADKARNAIE